VLQNEYRSFNLVKISMDILRCEWAHWIAHVYQVLGLVLACILIGWMVLFAAGIRKKPLVELIPLYLWTGLFTIIFPVAVIVTSGKTIFLYGLIVMITFLYFLKKSEFNYDACRFIGIKEIIWIVGASLIWTTIFILSYNTDNLNMIDRIYFAHIVVGLDRTGLESTTNRYAEIGIEEYHGISPYHYVEMWLTYIVWKMFGIEPDRAIMQVVIPFLELSAFLSLLIVSFNICDKWHKSLLSVVVVPFLIGWIYWIFKLLGKCIGKDILYEYYEAIFRWVYTYNRYNYMSYQFYTSSPTVFAGITILSALILIHSKSRKKHNVMALGFMFLPLVNVLWLAISTLTAMFSLLYYYLLIHESRKIKKILGIACILMCISAIYLLIYILWGMKIEYIEGSASGLLSSLLHNTRDVFYWQTLGKTLINNLIYFIIAHAPLFLIFPFLFAYLRHENNDTNKIIIVLLFMGLTSLFNHAVLWYVLDSYKFYHVTMPVILLFLLVSIVSIMGKILPKGFVIALFIVIVLPYIRYFANMEIKSPFIKSTLNPDEARGVVILAQSPKNYPPTEAWYSPCFPRCSNFIYSPYIRVIFSHHLNSNSKIDSIQKWNLWNSGFWNRYLTQCGKTEKECFSQLIDRYRPTIIAIDIEDTSMIPEEWRKKAKLIHEANDCNAIFYFYEDSLKTTLR